MKQSTVALVLFGLAMAAGMPYQLEEAEDGRGYVLAGSQRSKRGTTKWDVDPVKGTAWVKHDQTFLKNPNHEIYGSAYAQKNFKLPNQNEQSGGKVVYNNRNTDTSLIFKADHTRRQGTDLSLQGKWDIVKHKQGGVDLSGFYSKHVGRGPTISDRGVMLTGHIDLP